MPTCLNCMHPAKGLHAPYAAASSKQASQQQGASTGRSLVYPAASNSTSHQGRRIQPYVSPLCWAAFFPAFFKSPAGRAALCLQGPSRAPGPHRGPRRAADVPVWNGVQRFWGLEGHCAVPRGRGVCGGQRTLPGKQHINTSQGQQGSDAGWCRTQQAAHPDSNLGPNLLAWVPALVCKGCILIAAALTTHEGRVAISSGDMLLSCHSAHSMQPTMALEHTPSAVAQRCCFWALEGHQRTAVAAAAAPEAAAAAAASSPTANAAASAVVCSAAAASPCR